MRWLLHIWQHWIGICWRGRALHVCQENLWVPGSVANKTISSAYMVQLMRADRLGLWLGWIIHTRGRLGRLSRGTGWGRILGEHLIRCGRAVNVFHQRQLDRHCDQTFPSGGQQLQQRATVTTTAPEDTTVNRVISGFDIKEGSVGLVWYFEAASWSTRTMSLQQWFVRKPPWVRKEGPTLRLTYLSRQCSISLRRAPSAISVYNSWWDSNHPSSARGQLASTSSLMGHTSSVTINSKNSELH